MRIVIIGAGQVGSYLAERLAHEGQDIVVIESDPIQAAELQSTVDCLVITGSGTSQESLREARLGDADLLIAVTSSDAVNVLACHAAARFGVPRKVARVEDPDLRDELELLGVDAVIDPNAALAHELLLLVKRGGVSEVIEFADGQLVLIGGYIPQSAPMAGITLAELREQVSGWQWIVAALVRHGETIVARGDTTIEIGDHVLIMARTGETKEAIHLLGLEERPAHKVMVLGSTRLAQLTASELLSGGIHTVIIDEDPARTHELAAKYEKLVVVQGDPTDPRVLASEGIDNVDAVLALTGWDQVNVLGSLVAAAMGVSMTVARFHRVELVPLLAGVGISAAVSSRLAAANAILRFVRRGRIHTVAIFQDTDAEAIELQVGSRGDAVGKSLIEIGLPKSVIVGGVLRDGEAFVPHGSTVIAPGDRLTVFALPTAIASVEKLFA